MSAESPKFEKRAFSAKEIGAPIDPESMENREVFKASLGFDFIFVTGDDGVKRCYCIEINGDDSGSAGMNEIVNDTASNTRRLSTAIRDSRNTRLRHKYMLAGEVVDAVNNGAFDVSRKGIEGIDRFLKKSLDKERLILNALKNEEFLTQITKDKELQYGFIPEENRPRTWHSGESTESTTGYWIAKRRASRTGKDIVILTNADLATLVELPDFKEQFGQFVIQEFLNADPADTASEKTDHVASMRYLIDFVYNEDGSISPLYEAAYQRVAPEARRDIDTTTEREVNASYVVNNSTGAAAYRASDEELALAREAAQAIINRIADLYAPLVKAAKQK